MKRLDKFAMSQILTGFRIELSHALSASSEEMIAYGFDRDRVLRALISSTVVVAFDAMLEELGPEKAAKFISAIVNERLLSHQGK
jgi:hypothetical protein